MISIVAALCAWSMPMAISSSAAFSFAPYRSFIDNKNNLSQVIQPVSSTKHVNTALSSTTGKESFESLGLSADLLEVTSKMGWHEPSPVQCLAIPAILEMEASGENSERNSLWCEAPTGSGKTGAFSLPLLQILLNRKRPGSVMQQELEDESKGIVSSLILCPTRELAVQTGNVIERLVSYLPRKHRSAISVEVIHGGVPMEPQVSRLAKRRQSGTNVDILVATPGRLNDVLRHKDKVDPTISAMERRIMDAFDAKTEAKANSGGKKRKGKRGGNIAYSLSLADIQEMDLDRVDDDGRATLDQLLLNLDYICFDEADRLLGGAFKEEMDELLSLFPKKSEMHVKTLMVSATFPEQIEERVDRVLSRLSAGSPLRVSTSVAMLQRVPTVDDENDESALSNRQQKRLAHTTPITTVASDTAPRIQHRAIKLNERDRTQALRHLLETNYEWDRVLVFVATRYASEHVTRKLRRYNIQAAELHGKLDQDARDRRLKSFRSGKTQVLISTDLAARGIDVEGLPVVINYDLPRSAADFTHRTGRTGRAGKSGTAISFVTAQKESHFNFIERKELNGRTIEREVLPEFAIDESVWEIQSMASDMSTPGAVHSQKGLAHDRVFGGVKGRRKSKKDRLREAEAAKAARK
mmetsp:Transcript_30557/g.65468  ORF Transcript_30557/g.65468 Transcript_30557/m.65468 type:complete len:640 (+) Transcript_30557:183-2102(+)